MATTAAQTTTAQPVTFPADLAPLLAAIALQGRDLNWAPSTIRNKINQLLAKAEAEMNPSADETPTVWVAVDDYGTGVPAGGPFGAYQACADWIGFEDQLEPREMPTSEALAGLAETRRLANEQHEAFLAKRATEGGQR